MPRLFLQLLVLLALQQATATSAADAADAADAAEKEPLAIQYRAFGPLPYITERGAHPLLSLHQTTLRALSTLTTFPSETAVGGHASWRDCRYNATAATVRCPFPDADPTLPYSAWAVANLSVSTDPGHSQLLQCSDPPVIYSLSASPPDITRCPADTYSDGRALCAIRLQPGAYRVVVPVEARRNHTEFACHYIRRPAETAHIPLLPIPEIVAPDVVVSRHPFAARLAGPHLSLTLQNVHTTQWATAGSARLLDAPSGLRLAPHTSSDNHFPLPRIAPRQTRQLRVDLLTDKSFLSDISASLPANVTLAVAVSYDVVPTTSYEVVFNITFDVTEWRKSRSYRFTYVDVDGSVQAAAVLPPRHSCLNAPAGGDVCPVLLSTHGAGVDAVAHAWTESYLTQNQSWILLPTGRRKYGLNWEGPQMTSALTALRALAEKLPGVPPAETDAWKPRVDMWLQAGHSMGGHGALLLATHFPDMMLATLPAMGWLRLSSYAGIHYAEQLSYSDAASRALLSVASAEYSADLYAENLLGIPVLARVGSKDESVPPSELRKFCRLLKENEFFHNFSSTFVTLNEVEGEGHWFDGVVDDSKLQAFIDKHLGAPAKPRLPHQFSVFTINPASTGSRGGLRITSLEVPFQMSRLRVTKDSPNPGTWKVETENVRRFRYQFVAGIDDRPERLQIDGAEKPLILPMTTLEKPNKYVDICVSPGVQDTREILSDIRNVKWTICSDNHFWQRDRSGERGPDNTGPSFQVLAGRKVTVVYPEGDMEFLDAAVRYSNALYIRGISVQVTPDSEVSTGQLLSADDSNIILLGGPGMNRLADKFYEDGYSADVTFEEDRFCIARRKCFAKPGTGLAFLSSGRKRTLLFYVAGTDRDGLLAAMALLPFSPASNVPEWVVVSNEKGWGFRGLGGIIALGYWDYEWKLEPRKSYPAEFALDAKQAGMTCAVSQKTSSFTVWPVLLVILVCIVGLVMLWRCRQRRLQDASYEHVPMTMMEDTTTHKSSSISALEKETLMMEEKSTSVS